MVNGLTYRAQAFGLRWCGDHPMPLFSDAPDDGRAADVTIERVDSLPPRNGGRTINRGEIFADGVRFAFDGVLFEMTAGSRIQWCSPSARNLPHAFYSTMTAIVLAWRGWVPLHVSAVAVEGRAILIGGPSGAGKSTLTMALVARGAQLVSDDLSVVSPTGVGDTPMLWPGRPAVRLLPADGEQPLRGDKRLVRPAMVDIDTPVPAAMLLLLRRDPIVPGAAEAAEALRRQLFRPIWMRELPRAAERMTTILNAGRRLAIHTLPPAPAAPDETPAERADRALALMRATAIR